MLSISVVVPTYQRPDYLERCVRSLLAQRRLPEEILLVSREDDVATNSKIAELQRELSKHMAMLNPHVSQPGFLPPIRLGIKRAKGDIVAFLDDDAEAFPDWLERMIAFYEDPMVGGVGGRYVNFFNFKPVTYSRVRKVGHLSWYGRSVGNMYKDTTFSCAVEVDMLMGGNMSFRRDLLQRIEIDAAIGRDVAFHWELDLVQQIKSLGSKVLYDPKIKVNHFSAPRPVAGLRTINYSGVYNANFNYAYLMMKHLTPVGKVAYIVYTGLIGSEGSVGLGHLLYDIARGRRVPFRESVVASVRGRLAGIRSGFLGCKQARPNCEKK
jgi:GT2 family glycosyltransferase